MTDVELLELVKCYLAAPRGTAAALEAAAWRSFYELYDSLIRAALQQEHPLQSDIDDLDQDVWCILVRRLPTLLVDPALGTLRAWVKGIARKHAHFDACRRAWHNDEVLTPELVATLLDPTEGPGSTFDGRQRQEKVRAIFEEVGATLPELSYQIMVKHWIEEQRVAEIAADLGLRVNRVRAIVRRADLKLFESLRRGGLNPSPKNFVGF